MTKENPKKEPELAEKKSRPFKEEAMNCDFCGSENVVCEYDATDFTIALIAPHEVNHWQSEKGWLACKDCGELVDSENQEALIERSTMTHPLRTEKNDVLIRATVKLRHKGFWRHKTGKRREVVAYG